MMVNECDRREPRNLEPQKLILEAKSYFSRKFVPPRITHYIWCDIPKILWKKVSQVAVNHKIRKGFLLRKFRAIQYNIC